LRRNGRGGGAAGGKAATQETSTDVTHLAVKCFLWEQRAATLRDVLAVYGGPGIKTIIFSDTKAEANELTLGSGFASECQVLHGDIAQSQREITMQGFRDGKFDILVATDVAARGLDVPDIRLVIQCQPPSVETYVHRSGRTGRAGKKGTCITFFSRKDEGKLAAVERKTSTKIKRIGAPQPSDIMRASLRGVVKRLNTVHDDVVPYFMDAARQLLATRDAPRTLATALALIGGHTEPPAARSLVSSVEGFVTILFSSPEKPIVSQGFVWNALQRAGFSDRLTREVKGLQVRGGAVRTGGADTRTQSCVCGRMHRPPPPARCDPASWCLRLHALHAAAVDDRSHACAHAGVLGWPQRRCAVRCPPLPHGVVGCADWDFNIVCLWCSAHARAA
jgi:hypothetical protein